MLFDIVNISGLGAVFPATGDAGADSATLGARKVQHISHAERRKVLRLASDNAQETDDV